MIPFGSVVPIIALLTALLGTCTGQMSIPRREVGFVYNNARPDAPVKLEAFLDPTCPDSQQTWPVLLKVAEHFGKELLQYKMHLFPLPYHRNSHTISKGAHVIQNFKSKVSKNGTVFNWMTTIYDNIDKLTTTATASQTDVQVLEMLKPLAQKVAGISPSDFAEGVADSDIDSATRLAWKYGCTRGVYGTPMYLVNDVFVQADPSWNLQKWVDLINPLLKSSEETDRTLRMSSERSYY